MWQPCRWLVPPTQLERGWISTNALTIIDLQERKRVNTVLLDDLDQFAKHQLHAPHYVRYVDDFILLHPSPQWLNAVLADPEVDGLVVLLTPQSMTDIEAIARGVCKFHETADKPMACSFMGAADVGPGIQLLDDGGGVRQRPQHVHQLVGSQR